MVIQFLLWILVTERDGGVVDEADRDEGKCWRRDRVGEDFATFEHGGTHLAVPTYEPCMLYPPT